MSTLRSLWLFPIVSLFLSCASMYTSQGQYVAAKPYIDQRAFDQALLTIEGSKNTSYQEKDRVLFYLDSGMLAHFSGDYEKSNFYLDKAERGIEELYTLSISKAITSGVLNDNALDYRGEDYEDIYLNIFKSLNYIALNDQDGALVEVRRVQNKLNLLEARYRTQIDEYNQSEGAEGEIVPREIEFYNDVLARYLGVLLYREERSFDDARIELEKLQEGLDLQSQLYSFDHPSLPQKKLSQDMAHLSLMAFSGLSPQKVSETLYLDTGNDIVWITSVRQEENYVERTLGFNFIVMPGVSPGFHFKFEFPKMSQRGSLVTDIVLKIDDKEFQHFDLVEDMGAIAEEIFLSKQPLIIGKSIIRTVTKGILAEQGKAASNNAIGDNPFANLLLNLAIDVAVDATENADLRISPYFPCYASALDIQVEPGEHSISIAYYSGETLLFEDQRGVFDLRKGETQFIESFYLK